MFKNKQRRILSWVLTLALILSNFTGVIGLKVVKAATNHVVISQIYGGGGNTGAPYKNDFIELYNPTDTAINLTGWSLQYASATGVFSTNMTSLSGTIKAYGYYLYQGAGGTVGVAIPTADTVGNINLSGSAGKVALANTATAISGITDITVIDYVGFGTTANIFEGTGSAPAPSNTTSIQRKDNNEIDPTSIGNGNGNGWDTNNNKTDFVISNPIRVPKNSTSPAEGGTPPANVLVTGVSLDKPTLTIEEGKTEVLTQTVIPDNATNKKVTWSSDKETVATVSNGTVTAVAPGTATITVTTEEGGKTSVCAVTVTEKPTGDSTKPEITDLKPASGEYTGIITRPTISAKYNDASGIKLSSVILKVDNIDVTSLATITTTGITYVPANDLTNGQHMVNLQVIDNVSPLNISIVTWNFYIGIRQFSFYFGGLHSHTNLSDGTGTPNDAYAWARDIGKADFLAITDHSNWLDGEKDLANETLTDLNLSTSLEWKQLHQVADTFNTDGKFVALAAYEMTWSGSTGGWGHINTFNTPWFVSRSDTNMDLKSYYAKLAQSPQSISQLNHPGKTFGDFSDFGFYTPEADKVVNLIEVGNGEGLVRGNGYFPSYDYYTRALDKGWHVAPTNNQDNHKGNWISSNTARTVIVAPSLTRDSLYEAMSNRRVYATEDENLKIDYTVNNQLMGSILNSPSSLDAIININDPDPTDVIGKVSIIVDGGKVLASKTFTTNSAQWNVSLDTNYSYYYIRVDEGDKDIAISAPVWANAVVPVGISKVEVSQDPQIVNKPVDITATIYNNSTQALNNIKVEYFQGSVVSENKIGEATILSVPTSGVGTSKITWTPTQTGDIKIYAQATINQDGKDIVFIESTTFKVANAGDMFKVVIDGGHVNQYVSGDYAGKMLTLTSMLRDKQYMLVENPDELTAQDLENAKILIITDPQSVTKSPLTSSKFTDKEIQVIKDFVNGGGSLIITSRADYNDKGVVDNAYQSSVQGNSILEAIGSNLRFNDDEVIDKTSNGGQEYRLYFDNYTSSKYNLTSNVPSGETYSFYSGCSVILKSGGYETNVDWLVKGHDTTEILDSDLANDAIPVTKGDVNGLAAEVLSNGSKVIVAGSTFFSDFETAAVDNAYSNKLITENILSWMSTKAPAQLKTIAEVRADLNNDGVPDNAGMTYAIEGRITAQSEAVTPKNAFFEVIYVQDETGGICIFGVSNTALPLGTKVKVTGIVSQYQNDSQLALTDESKQLEITDTKISLIDAKIMTTKKGMEEANEGWLVKLQGKVTRIEGQNMFIDDGSGEARIYLEGYISDETGNDATRGKWNANIKVGEAVSAIGLASQDPEGHRLRVRNTSEIVLVDTTAPVITISGAEEDKFYNVDVTPVVTTDDNKAIVTMTLNGKEYKGEKIVAEGKYALIVNAADLAGNTSTRTIVFIIDKTAPIIFVKGVEDGKIYKANVTPIINVNEGTFTAKLNDKEYKGEEIIAEGKYVLIITATDLAGNMVASTINFTIDKTEPIILVTGVILNSSSESLNIGETYQLIATIQPSNATNGKLMYKSSDEKIATVDANGKVTAMAVGTCTITVTTEEGNKIATCIFNVKPVATTIPKTGSPIDLTILILLGGILIVTGTFFMFKKKQKIR